jgi:superfamily II DNA/RNA helicase
VLFATDVASRGLDFPAVNWVVQMDCPEDCHTYIHRAGRTARFEEGGEALLMLTPNEEKGDYQKESKHRCQLNLKYTFEWVACIQKDIRPKEIGLRPNLYYHNL